MNWTKFTPFFAAALFYALCFLAPTGWTDTLTLNKEGLLTISSDEDLDQSAFDSLIPADPGEDDPTALTGIKIEEDGTLNILTNTEIKILKTTSSSQILVEGTLTIINNTDTKLYSYAEDEEDGEVPTKLSIDLEGGTITILDGDSVIFDLNADINMGTEGGTIDIAAGNTLKVGAIPHAATGDLTIKGGGTLQVAGMSMGGKLDLQAGTLHLLKDSQIGTLISAENTIIDGLRTGEEKNSNLIITSEDSVIEGTLKNIGILAVGNESSTAASLELKGGIQHDVDSIAIYSGGVLDLQAGTSIKLTKPLEVDVDEDERKYDDMLIYGTLRVSSAVGTGIYKGDLPSDLDPTYITVGGNTNSNGDVISGIIEIIDSDDDPKTEEYLYADSLHTQILNLGKINVDKGVTFESGKITFGKGEDGKRTGAHLFVDGGGTYKAGTLDLGAGNLYVHGKEAAEGTMMEFLDTVKANGLVSEVKTKIIANGDAEFTAVELAGDYDALGNNLTITKGGHITGQVSNVDNFKVGGGLFLAANDNKTTISAKTWEVEEGTYIRTVGGTESGDYAKVLQVENDTDRAELLDILEASRTALYQAHWTENPDDETYLDLQLSVLGIDQYVYSIWNQRGSNANNTGALVEYLCDQYPNFREGLESLSHEQLQGALRTVMAGELAGNAVRLAMQQPGQSVFRHLDTVVPLRFPFSNVRGQVREGFNVWFNPYGQSERADSDGNTFDGYKMTRFGFHLGGDIELYNRALLGVLFGYANPQVKSGLGKIAANDYSAGMYLRLPTAWAVVANLMAGFGNQSYTYKNSYHDSEYRGNSFFASAELTRPISFQTYRLTPLVAFDFQSAKVDNFLVFDPILGGVYVQPDDIKQAALRFGVLGNFGRFRTRLQYTRQIAGDDSVSSRTAVLGVLSAATQIRSTEWGKDWLNVGVGGEVLTTRHWRLFADYNFDLGKHTSSHLGSLNAVLTW